MNRKQLAKASIITVPLAGLAATALFLAASNQPTRAHHHHAKPVPLAKPGALTTKPVLLSETSIGPIAGQARYIPDLFAGISQYHLRGLVWFDVAQHDPPVHQNWRLEGNPAAVAAFRRAASALEGS